MPGVNVVILTLFASVSLSFDKDLSIQLLAKCFCLKPIRWNLTNKTYNIYCLTFYCFNYSIFIKTTVFLI